MEPLPYPRNPDYGRGVYRRRVRVIVEGAEATAILNDDFHAMWCWLQHDGRTIGAVRSELLRMPKNTCPGAASALSELSGIDLQISRSGLYGEGRAGRQCTHLLDLALLAIAQIRRGDGHHIYDVAIPDYQDDHYTITGAVDGGAPVEWTIADGQITAPEDHKSQPLFQGFAHWAERQFAGLELDLARMMQKAAFVARGRKYAVDQIAGVRATLEPHRLGACYSFSHPQFALAESNLGYVRDFSAALIEVLPDHLKMTERNMR